MSKQKQLQDGAEGKDVFDTALEDYGDLAGAAIGALAGWRYGKRLIRKAGGPAYRAEGPAVKTATATVGGAAGWLGGAVAAGDAARRNYKKEQRRKKK